MKQIRVSVTVRAPLAKVWEYWTNPQHISGWAFADDSWGAEGIENTLAVGGNFRSRMFAKDGSMEFDFTGTYTAVETEKFLAFTLADDRKVCVAFAEGDDGVHITEAFDPESENPEEQQRAGWQAYLDNFKKYVESA